MKLKRKITVGVIFGGQSGEHEVSLVSAKSVIDGLEKEKYNVIPIGIMKTGHWIYGRDALYFLKNGQGKRMRRECLIPEQCNLTVNKQTSKLLNNYNRFQAKIDVIFPVLHGPYGEDGTLQGLLELAHLPYVGAGVLSSACGMDKAVMKALFSNAKLPGPKYISFTKAEWHKNKNSITMSVNKYIKYPNFTKPANLGSSVGIMKCHNINEFLRGIALAFKYDRKAIVEEAINGREIECSVLGNNYPIASVPGEIIPNREFYDYEAKYIDGQSELLLPAPLTARQRKNIQELAIKAFQAIDCSGLARVDFFVENGTNRILINEINTLPGFTSISMYPKLWHATGISYKKLLDTLIKLAFERHVERERILSSFRPSKKWYA